MRIVFVVAMGFVLIYIKPRALHILTHFIFATSPWDRYAEAGAQWSLPCNINLYIFIISAYLHHGTVTLRMQGPYCFLAPWSNPTL